ncbi:hypothetical protein [Croceibacterium aestuarii]|uniref:hypothetical protein n=1 Tax=Croceibacterium aestuarii TaxID=3064139 RepID=UPI00272DF057|nr:hypothetical protein [Croceibacterium sp. D39]
MIVSYGYPLLFGLTVYGTFVGATALTFVVQRIVDLIAESTLAERDPGKLIRSSTVTAACALAALAAVRSFVPGAANVPFDLPLFITVFLSTVVLNLCFQIGTPVAQLSYAVAYGAINFSVSAVWFLNGRTDLALALTITNGLGVAMGLGLLAWPKLRSPPVPLTTVEGTRQMLRQLPSRLMFAGFQIVVTYGAVLAASFQLTDRELGVLRLFTTFAVLGYTLSPINSKALYGISRGISGPRDLMVSISPFAPVLAALGFAWLCADVAVAYWGVAKGSHIYYVAVALYPTILFSSIFEKILIHRRGVEVVGIGVGVWSAAIAGFLLFATYLTDYAYALLGGMSLYPTFLATVFARDFLRSALVATCLTGVGLAIALSSGTALAVTALLGLLALSTLFVKGWQWMQ